MKKINKKIPTQALCVLLKDQGILKYTYGPSSRIQRRFECAATFCGNLPALVAGAKIARRRNFQPLTPEVYWKSREQEWFRYSPLVALVVRNTLNGETR